MTPQIARDPRFTIEDDIRGVLSRSLHSLLHCLLKLPLQLPYQFKKLNHTNWHTNYDHVARVLNYLKYNGHQRHNFATV